MRRSASRLAAAATVGLLLAGCGGDTPVVADHPEASQSPATDLIVFLQKDATAAQIADVAAALRRHPEIATIRYIDHEAAFEEFRSLLGSDAPSEVSGPDGFDAPSDLPKAPSDLPTSFRVTLAPGSKGPDAVGRLLDELNGMPGVQAVVAPS
jgi:cell division protein FtsX